MNWFLVGIGVAYLGAAASSFLREKPLWGILFALFAVADFISAVLEARP